MGSIFKFVGGLGRLWELWGLCGSLFVPLGHLGFTFGALWVPFWLILSTLGSILAPFWDLWAPLGDHLGYLGPLWVPKWKKYKKGSSPAGISTHFWPHFWTLFHKKWVRGECLFSCCVFFNFWWLPGWPNPWSTHAGAVQTQFFSFQVFLKIDRTHIKF